MKVKIKQPKEINTSYTEEYVPKSWEYEIEIDGRDVTDRLKSVGVKMVANRFPEVSLTYIPDEIELEGDFPEIKVRKG